MVKQLTCRRSLARISETRLLVDEKCCVNMSRNGWQLLFQVNESQNKKVLLMEKLTCFGLFIVDKVSHSLNSSLAALPVEEHAYSISPVPLGGGLIVEEVRALLHM